MSSFSIGPQGGKAIYSPSYLVNLYSTTYNFSQLQQTIKFKRVMGPQRIIMTLIDGSFKYNFSFSITGGTNMMVTNALPMFPNPAKVYNPSINFVLDQEGIPPIGCNVQTEPIPESKTKSRINIFRITETLSGSSYTFILSLCPFSNIDSTIEIEGPSLPSGSSLVVSSEFFRVNPNLRTDGIPISFMSPSYKTKSYETIIDPVSNVSPINSTDIPFTRFAGQQTILFINYQTGYHFSIEIDYGIIGQGNGYLGYVSPTSNGTVVQGSKPVGCQVLNVSTPGQSITSDTKLKIITDVLDGGGREYIIKLYPSAYQNKDPTIKLLSGATIGNETLGIQVYGRYFYKV